MEKVLLVFSDDKIELRTYKGNKLSAAQQISDSFFAELNKNYGKKKERQIVIHGEVPKSIISFKSVPHVSMLWMVPEGPRELVFSDKKNDGIYYMPNMLFFLSANTLNVYPYKEVKGEIITYQAKFPNVGSNSMCMGSVKANYSNEMTYEALIAMGEGLFFNSKFSHKIESTWFPKMKNAKTFDYKLLKTKKWKLKKWLEKN